MKILILIDYNHEAIFMAWEMINWLWINNISFKQIDAVKYDYSNADIVIIPIFVNKKSEVIKQVIQTAPNKVQILVTSPKWFWNLVYEWIEHLNPRVQITDKKDFSSSFIAQEIIKLEKYNF